MLSKNHISYILFVTGLLENKLISIQEASELLDKPMPIYQILDWLNFKQTELGKELN